MSTLRGILLLAILAASPASAGKLFLNVSDVTVLPVGEEAVGRVALRIPVPELGSRAQIHEVRLEGHMPGIPDDGGFRLWARRITEDWSPQGARETAPRADSQPVALWEVSVRDYGRTGSFVRLDLTRLVRKWQMGRAENYGLVLEAEEVDAEALARGVAQLQIVILFSR